MRGAAGEERRSMQLYFFHGTTFHAGLGKRMGRCAHCSLSFLATRETQTVLALGDPRALEFIGESCRVMPTRLTWIRRRKIRPTNFFLPDRAGERKKIEEVKPH
jgi:hypothetical protein